jgi:hypothetical protein
MQKFGGGTWWVGEIYIMSKKGIFSFLIIFLCEFCTQTRTPIVKRKFFMISARYEKCKEKGTPQIEDYSQNNPKGKIAK